MDAKTLKDAATAHPALVSAARDWIADAYPQSPFDMSDEHPVYDESAEGVRRFVSRHYDGGWSAFVADAAV